MKYKIHSKTLKDTKRLAELLAQNVILYSVVELIGDIGVGKTTFTQFFVKELGSEDIVDSPTFTLSNSYFFSDRDIYVKHYDFYRLEDAGIMKLELQESIDDSNAIVVIEWGDIVADVLPDDSIKLHITSTSVDEREFTLDGPKELIEIIKKEF